jgi:hypothetical protein
MRQRFVDVAFVFTAGHHIFPSPSLTGWTAFILGVRPVPVLLGFG